MWTKKKIHPKTYRVTELDACIERLVDGDIRNSLTLFYRVRPKYLKSTRDLVGRVRVRVNGNLSMEEKLHYEDCCSASFTKLLCPLTNMSTFV